MTSYLVAELSTLGFSDRLAQAYVFVLQQGETSVNDIASALSLTRQTAHDVMTSLVNHDFVQMRNNGKRNCFIAQSPMKIRQLLEAKRKEDERRLEQFDVLLPRLSALAVLGDNGCSVIRTARGIEGLVLFQREFEELAGDILQLFDFDVFSQLEQFRATNDHREKIVTAGKRVRSILVTDRFLLPAIDPLFEFRCIPRDIISIPGEMSVCEDHVLLLSYENDISVVSIRSRAVADVCRASLELAWRAVEGFGKQAPHPFGQGV